MVYATSIRRPHRPQTTSPASSESPPRAALMAPARALFCASRRRFAQIREGVAARGVAEADLSRVKSPAGLDIGARAPEEIALSILAEIVQVRRAASDQVADTSAADLPAAAAREEIDPFCGMRVTVAGARHTASAGGRDWYFCCGGCRERFLAAPERYSAPKAGIAGLGGTS